MTNFLVDIGMIAIAVLLIFLLIKILAAPIKGIIKFLLYFYRISMAKIYFSILNLFYA